MAGANSSAFADIREARRFAPCRKNDLLKLPWDRVDLKAGDLRLEGENTKNGLHRFVPLSAVVLEALQSRTKFVLGVLPRIALGICAWERRASSAPAKRL